MCLKTGLMRQRSIYDNMFDQKILCDFYRGSIAHNLHIGGGEKFPTDDTDTMVVYVYPKQYYLTLESFHHVKEVFEEKHDDIDVVGYEIKKMFHLLSQMNPNVLPALYTREQDFTTLSPEWKLIREKRDIFINKTRIRDVFLGYAKAQYRRMIDKKSWFGYMGAKRKELYEKLGYDAKYASHSIRRLRMGGEFLRDGAPVVYREADRDELIAIKQGEWTLENIQKLYAQEMLNVEQAYGQSKLQDKATKHKVNKLLFEVMESL